MRVTVWKWSVWGSWIMLPRVCLSGHVCVSIRREGENGSERDALASRIWSRGASGRSEGLLRNRRDERTHINFTPIWLYLRSQGHWLKAHALCNCKWRSCNQAGFYAYLTALLLTTAAGVALWPTSIWAWSHEFLLSDKKEVNAATAILSIYCKAVCDFSSGILLTITSNARCPRPLCGRGYWHCWL